ncbi:Transcriptional regulator, ArsR family [hydrothermal vent metagenome]|uniref:Transcriptional regulator, ArsR family n=1 Tax=hydrothermal vent metagenome TaxID=652676 RepID=A0A3B1DNF4_9ZZZZ
MNKKTRKQYEARAKVAKAMAHPSRLLILDLLQKQEMCVNDLTDKVGADQSTVSKHLAILKETGLVDARKEGTMSYYRVSCGCLDGFFSCIETVLLADVKGRQKLLR